MRRTLCVYCGERLDGPLRERTGPNVPERNRIDRQRRRAASIACPRHLDVALYELYGFPQEPVEGGDE